MLASGKSGLELALYVLLPVLVIMMAIMKVLEARGVLALVARTVQPGLRLFGIPGAGAFAIVQMLFVSFAAPLATLSIMEKDGTSRREIAATLAMILTLSQANVVFPLVAAGLNLGVIMLTSLIGGLAAAAATYYLFARSADDGGSGAAPPLVPGEKRPKTTTLNLLIVGGQEGVKVILDTIPMLILAIFLVNLLKSSGAMALLETVLAPLFHLVGFPAVAGLPLATKYLAGGFGYGHAKTALLELILDKFRNEREAYNRFMADKGLLDAELKKGADKARAIGTPVLERVRAVTGF